MKRLLLLLLTLAISVSLASVTLAVYQRSMTVPDVNVGNKIFDVFLQPAYSVTEPRPAVNVPEWHFSVFNNVTHSTPSDLSITVSFNTSSTSGLVVEVLNHNGEVLASSAFGGSSSTTIVFQDYIPAETTIRNNLRLRFSHNSLLLSPTNNPFGGTTAQYSVTVSAQPQEQEENLIEKVMNNRWFRLGAAPGTGNRVLFDAQLYAPPHSDSTQPNNTRTGTIEIIYSSSNGHFIVRRNNVTSPVFLGPLAGINPNDVITPTGIVLYGEQFDQGKILTISNVSLNGNIASDTFVFDDEVNAYLLTDLPTDPNGDFYISFDYAFENGGYNGDPVFGIYLGYI